MKKYPFLSILSLFLIFFTSCEYDPHGIYERHLNKNLTSPDIEVVSLDLDQNKDTIVLLYNRVTFRFKSSNQAISQVNFILDDSLLGSVQSGEGYFDMRCDSLYIGNHRLRLEIYTYTGTGSIADSLGMESIVFASREWTVKILQNYFYNMTSTVSDGFLKLQWPRPPDNVSYFMVYRGNIKLGQTTDCEYIDKGYVGEGAEFSVWYYSPFNGALVKYGWVEIPNEMELKYTADEGNHFAVAWEQPKYYAAFDSIIVFGRDGFSMDQRLKTGDVEQRSFEIPASLFGQVRYYRMGLVPKYLNPVYSLFHNPYPYFVSPEITCAIGFPSPIFRDFNRISPAEFIYHTDMYDHGSTAYNDSIFRYSTLDNRIEERYRYNPPDYTWSGDHYWNPTSSPDGSHYMAVAGFTGTSVYSPSDNFRHYKISDISNLAMGVAKIPVSNVGTGIIYGSGYKYLYDFEKDTLLGTIENSIALSDYDISPDGRYLFLSVSHTVDLYGYANDTLTLEKTISKWSFPGCDYFGFMADEPHRIVAWNAETKEFSILGCPGLEIINTYPVPEDKILDVDYFNDRILSSSAGKLVVRSLADGSVQEEIPLHPGVFPSGRCFLGGNSIFNSHGARYFLK